jgi:hypothetical protein
VEYRRREPETSVLYRLVCQYFHQLKTEWELRFQSKYGVLRSEVTRSFEQYLTCGILDYGCAKAWCPSCHHAFLVAFSCKRRGCCPSCAAKRAVMFAENLHAKVLGAVPVRHMVFTIPKRIRPYFQYDRQLLAAIATAAWDAISHVVEVALGSDVIPAAVLALHTASETLGWNPHVHLMVADGGFTRDDSFVRLSDWDESTLQKHFSSLLLTLLVERELMDGATAQQILGQQHTGFSVWCERIVEADDTEGRLFLGRYLAKSPLALERIVLSDDAVVVHAERRKLPDWTGTPLDFLARLSAHIPGHYEHLERFFGRYSSATRGKRGDLVIKGDDDTEDAPPQPPESSAPCPRATRWATLMARLYELQPLQCLKCGAEMILKAFITDPFEIQQLLTSLGIPQYRAPPPLPAHYQPTLPIFE